MKQRHPIVDAVTYQTLRSASSPITEQDPNVFAFHQVIMDGLAKIKRVQPLGTLSIIVDDIQNTHGVITTLRKACETIPAKRSSRACPNACTDSALVTIKLTLDYRLQICLLGQAVVT